MCRGGKRDFQTDVQKRIKFRIRKLISRPNGNGATGAKRYDIVSRLANEKKKIAT